MTCEEPIVNKCCGIIPNRHCLVTFAVLKIIADLIASLVFGYIWLVILVFYKDIDVSSLLIDVGFMLDIPFMVILTIGAWKKSNYHLNISLYYSIISLISAVIITVVYIILTYTSDSYFVSKHFYSYNISEIQNMLLQISLLFLYTLLHVCMILVMKSEVMKTTINGKVYHKMEHSKDSVAVL